MSKSQIFLLPLILLLSACGEMPKLEVPTLDLAERMSAYHLDVRQGNLITQEMVSQLKPGLTREQVRYVLGTPLVTDPFHGNRWDYVYRYDNGKGEIQQRNLSVYFEDNKLLRVGGDVTAADPNAAANLAEAPKRGGAEAANAASAAAAVTPSAAPQ